MQLESGRRDMSQICKGIEGHHCSQDKRIDQLLTQPENLIIVLSGDNPVISNQTPVTSSYSTC